MFSPIGKRNTGGPFVEMAYMKINGNWNIIASMETRKSSNVQGVDASINSPKNEKVQLEVEESYWKKK